MLNGWVAENDMGWAYYNLGNLYSDQGKLAEAELMYDRALKGDEKALGPEHMSTLDIVNNLALLYRRQGKLTEAELMYERALKGYEKALGPDNTITYLPSLNTIRGLGSHFERQANIGKARMMYSKALGGYEKAVGPDDSRSRRLRDKIHALDAVTEDESSIDVGESGTEFREETSDQGVAETPPKSKRHKLLTKLGFR
jgi:tetratricopeptide (TPR) repeat protein